MCIFPGAKSNIRNKMASPAVEQIIAASVLAVWSHGNVELAGQKSGRRAFWQGAGFDGAGKVAATPCDNPPGEKAVPEQ